MARDHTPTIFSRRVVTLLFLALVSGMLALENWPAATQVSQTRDDVAAVGTDLSHLPVMYD